MTRLDNHVVDRPSCQAETPAQCSQCTLSYDCHRVRSGRQLHWAIVAVLVVAGVTLLSKIATGV